MAKIKICGLSRLEDINEVNEYLPDYIGFIFAKSKRQVSLVQAKKLKTHLNKKILAVGVFVNEPIENIVKIVDEGIIDIIQLHGTEDEDYIKNLRTYTNKHIIKAIAAENIESIQKGINSSADYLLFDKAGGGTGQSFDWNLLVNVERDFFLAGGIDLHNINQALTTINPFAIDVSSSVETYGYKDKNKINMIIRRVRDENKR